MLLRLTSVIISHHKKFHFGFCGKIIEIRTNTNFLGKIIQVTQTFLWILAVATILKMFFLDFLSECWINLMNAMNHWMWSVTLLNCHFHTGLVSMHPTVTLHKQSYLLCPPTFIPTRHCSLSNNVTTFAPPPPKKIPRKSPVVKKKIFTLDALWRPYLA